MYRWKSPGRISVQFFTILTLTSSISEPVFAQPDKKTLPENARTKIYGSGWECKNGYQLLNNACVMIKVPENAYLTNSSYVDHWKCNWGFRKKVGQCVAIKIPANAYLNSNGNDWQCKRGFKTLNNTCIAVKVPENGYFVESNYGIGWECQRGYVAQSNVCVALQVPVNAHIDYSEHDWKCNPPYNKKKNKCVLPKTDY